MEGSASISKDVLARYAADAAREVDGVRGLVEGRLSRRAVRVSDERGESRVEIHLDVEWDASIPEVGRSVQVRVKDYLERMAGAIPVVVDVVVDGVGPPS